MWSGLVIGYKSFKILHKYFSIQRGGKIKEEEEEEAFTEGGNIARDVHLGLRTNLEPLADAKFILVCKLILFNGEASKDGLLTAQSWAMVPIQISCHFSYFFPKGVLSGRFFLWFPYNRCSVFRGGCPSLLIPTW